MHSYYSQNSKGLDSLAKPRIEVLKPKHRELQCRIMDQLNSIVDSNIQLRNLFVFRLCSVLITRFHDEFSFTVQPHILPVPLGLTDGFHLLQQDAELQRKIFESTKYTLEQSGQLEYLAKNWHHLKDWKVFVDVDFYYNRPPEQAGFHKDTVGHSLFVNLNFNNPAPTIGPEYILNAPLINEHEQFIQGKLPHFFLSDLTEQRVKLGPSKEIFATHIPAYGMVSLVDELVHHSTPYRDHRGLSEQQLDQAIANGESSNPYQQARTIYVLENIMTGTSKAKVFTVENLRSLGIKDEDIQKYLFPFPNSGFITTGNIIEKLSQNPAYQENKVKFLQNLQYAQYINFIRFSKTKQHFQKTDLEQKIDKNTIDGLFKLYNKPDMDSVSMANCNDDCHIDTHNKNYPIQPPGFNGMTPPPLKRQMSKELLLRTLPPVPEGKRQFLRTWVQAIKGPPVLQRSTLKKPPFEIPMNGKRPRKPNENAMDLS